MKSKIIKILKETGLYIWEIKIPLGCHSLLYLMLPAHHEHQVAKVNTGNYDELWRGSEWSELIQLTFIILVISVLVHTIIYIFKFVKNIRSERNTEAILCLIKFLVLISICLTVGIFQLFSYSMSYGI